MSLVSLVGKLVAANEVGTPKNHVLGSSSLKGLSTKQLPAKIRERAIKPRMAGCHRNPQPSKGPGRNRAMGV
jgi:hypothetical protein